MLVDGRWVGRWQPLQATDTEGGFVRQGSRFRHWITPGGAAGPSGEGGFRAESDRYHLYVALTCPWASRTLIARKLKKLEQVIPVTVVEPALSEQGWRFDAADPDPLSGARFLHELYTLADPAYSGRATVPVLWDKVRHTIVNNESADIVRMLNSGFGAMADGAIDLYPEDLRGEIDQLNDRHYEGLNNGVYRAGLPPSRAPTSARSATCSPPWTCSRVASPIVATCSASA
jgi:putative glutathione S-transferase